MQAPAQAAHPMYRQQQWHPSRPPLTQQGLRQLSVRMAGPDSAVSKKVQADTLATLSQLPIQHKRIFVTAPRQYASKLSGLLVEAGAVPLWVPGVAISRLDTTTHQQQLAELDEALLQLGRYSHLAFTSKNGILAVLERLEELVGGHDAVVQHVQASGVQLAALGADGRVLEEYGLRVDVSPPEPSTTGLVAALEQQARGSGAPLQQQQQQQQQSAATACGPSSSAAAATSGQHQGAQQDGQRLVRVLCPVPLVTGGLVEPPVVPKFLAGLTSWGADPHRVDAYQTSLGLPDDGWCAAEAALLAEGQVDAIAFSSQAEAQGLCLLMGGRQQLVSWIKQYNVLLAAHGPYTAAGVETILGLPVPCVSKSFGSFHGLVTALSQHLK